MPAPSKSASRPISSWSIATFWRWPMAGIRRPSPTPTRWRPGSAARKSMRAARAERREAAVLAALATVAPALALTGWTAPAVAAPADAVYVNAYVYTVDARASVQEALAVRDGRIAYVGSNAGARALAGSATRLVDGHMHPLDGGTVLLKCNLNYERLTVAQMQSRIQACLDQTQAAEPDKWLEVVNWFREAMLPNGVATSRATLDSLKTRRPIFVMSSFGHTALVNTRALQLAK